METKNSKNLLNFKKAWSAIGVHEKRRVLNEIRTECGFTTDIQVLNRRIGRTLISETELKIITKAFSNVGVNVVTGELLQTVAS